MIRLFAMILLVATIGLGACQPHDAAPAPNSSDLSAAAFDPAKHDWPHSISDVLPDPDIHFGRLDNGLRYMILPGKDKAGRLSLRLQINVGQYDEPEDLYGIAHLLEHMAFKGSKNIEPEDIFNQLQEKGLTIGHDANAYTAPDRTFYMFDFPDSSAASLDQGLFILGDIAQHLTLDGDNLDVERDVVLAERAFRETPRMQAQRAKYQFIYPQHTRFGASLAGTKESLAKITLADLKAYYKQHYRPDNSLVVITGDVSARKAKAHIRKYFADWKIPPGEDLPAKRNRVVPIFEGDKHFKLSGVSGQFMAVHNSDGYLAKDTKAALDTRLLGDIAMDAFTARIKRLAENNKHINYMSPAFARNVEGNAAMVAIGTKKYAQALILFDQRRRLSIEYGFSDAEIKRAIATRKLVLKQQQRDEGGIDTPSEASGLLLAHSAARIPQSPEQRLEQLERVSQNASLKDYQTVFRDMWGTFELRLWRQGQQPIPSGFFEDIRTQLSASRTAAVEQVDVPDLPQFQARGLGEPASVTDANILPGTPIERLTLSNGARLHLLQKANVQEQIAVTVLIRADFAKLSERIVLASDIFRAMSMSDIKGYSETDMKAMFAGQEIGFKARLEGQDLTLSVTTNPEDLPDALAVMVDFIQNLDVESSAWARRQRNTYSSRYKSRAASPLIEGRTQLDYILSGKNPMFYRSAFLNARTEIVGVIQDTLKNGSLDIGVAGRFEKAAVVSAVKKTFGAVGPRPNAAADVTKFDDLAMATGAQILHTYRGPDDLMALYYCWSLTMPDNSSTRRSVRLASSILKNKVRDAVRIEKGATYTPVTALRNNRQFPGFRYLCGGVQIEMERELEVRRVMQSVIADLEAGKFNRDDFNRAKEPLVIRAERQSRNNKGLSYYAAHSTRDPEWAAGMLKYAKAMRSVKFKSEKAAIASIFKSENYKLVRIHARGDNFELHYKALSIRAELGDAQGQLELAGLYSRDGVPGRDPEKQIYWLEQAAEQGLADAQYQAGRFYARKGEHQNFAKSADWLEKALLQNHVKAGYGLAQLYFKNLEVFPDITNEEIIALYRTAAEAGDSSAQEALGQRYLDGSMLPRNRVAALMWAYISQDNGNLDMYTLKLARFEADMNAEEKDAARKQADEWVVKFRKAKAGKLGDKTE